MSQRPTANLIRAHGPPILLLRVAGALTVLALVAGAGAASWAFVRGSMPLGAFVLVLALESISGGLLIGALLVWLRHHRRILTEFEQRREAVHETVRLYSDQLYEREQELIRLRSQTMLIERIGAAAGWDYDCQLDILHWSDGLYRLCGRGMAWHPDRKGFIDLVHPEDRPAFAEAFALACEIGQDLSCTIRLEHGGLHGYRQVRLVARTVMGKREQVERLIGIVIDVDAQAQAEEARRGLEQILTSGLNLIADGIIAVDHETRIHRINASASERCGWSTSQAIGRSLGRVLRLLDEATRADIDQPLAEALEEGRNAARPREAILLDRLGCEHRITYRTATIRDRLGRVTGAVLCFQDIDARLRLEEKFRQAQKLELVGRLAGGIAHDFNNLLCGIMGYADLLKRRLPPEDDNQRHATAILDATGRATELARKLLDFARRGRQHDGEIDLHHLLRDVSTMITHSQQQEIRIDHAFTAERVMVRGDGAQLQSVFLNLAINACDAMPAGGDLRMATSNHTIEAGDPLAISMELSPGLYCRIDLSDNGCGMDQHLLNKIFEPFFTTKAVGKGTGLGLPAVHGALADHGGAITVSSQPGQGSTFTCYLPVLDRLTASERRRFETARHGRGECVLVVDDEDIVRRMASEMLSEIGYRVLEAENGRVALDLFKREQRHIRLVLLDLVMPEMNGTTTRHALHAIDPNLPIVITSGFAVDRGYDRAATGRPCGFLRKPFTAATLQRAISEQLDVPVEPTVAVDDPIDDGVPEAG